MDIIAHHHLCELPVQIFGRYRFAGQSIDGCSSVRPQAILQAQPHFCMRIACSYCESPATGQGKAPREESSRLVRLRRQRYLLYHQIRYTLANCSQFVDHLKSTFLTLFKALGLSPSEIELHG
jgi:hypothetical protein